jgi:hypothetical protein
MKTQRRKEAFNTFGVVSCDLLDRISNTTTTIHEITPNLTNQIVPSELSYALCVFAPLRSIVQANES